MKEKEEQEQWEDRELGFERGSQPGSLEKNM